MSSKKCKPYPLRRRSNLPTRLPPLERCTPSPSGENINTESIESETLANKRSTVLSRSAGSTTPPKCDLTNTKQPATMKCKTTKVLSPIKKERYTPSPPPGRSPCLTENARVPIRARLRKTMQPLPPIQNTRKSPNDLENKPCIKETREETKGANSAGTSPESEMKSAEVSQKKELRAAKPVLNKAPPSREDNHVKKRLKNHMKSENKRELDLLPSRFSPGKLAQKRPETKSGETTTTEMPQATRLSPVGVPQQDCPDSKPKQGMSAEMHVPSRPPPVSWVIPHDNCIDSKPRMSKQERFPDGKTEQELGTKVLVPPPVSWEIPKDLCQNSISGKELSDEMLLPLRSSPVRMSQLENLPESKPRHELGAEMQVPLRPPPVSWVVPQDICPDSIPGQESSAEMSNVLEQVKKLYHTLLEIKGKYVSGLSDASCTAECCRSSEPTVDEAITAKDHIEHLKRLVAKMTNTVSDMDSGLSCEFKNSRADINELQYRLSYTKEKLNENLLFYDKEVQAFKEEIERLKKENAELKKSLDDNVQIENFEFDYLEGLVANSYLKDRAEQRCKEVEGINKILKKGLDYRIRELKNLRSDMRKREQCPKNIIEGYTTLRNERDDLYIELAQLRTDINEAVRKRMNIDAVNQKLRVQVEKLKIQVAELGGDVSKFSEPDRIHKKFSFSKPDEHVSGTSETPKAQSEEEEITESSKESAKKDNENSDETCIIKQEEPANEISKDHLISAPSKQQNDSDDVNCIANLLQGVANNLQGTGKDLSLTEKSPKAIRLYFNLDQVDNEILRLEKQFIMSTVKDTTIRGERGVVYKRLQNRSIKATQYKKKIRNLIKANKNTRVLMRIVEQEPTDEPDSAKESEIKGDVMLLLYASK